MNEAGDFLRMEISGGSRISDRAQGCQHYIMLIQVPPLKSIRFILQGVVHHGILLTLENEKVEVEFCFQSESQMIFKKTNQVSFFKIEN